MDLISLPTPLPSSPSGGAALPWREALPGLRILRRGLEPVRAIQIYGQRCSGTNALARLVERNLGPDLFFERYGFKHWFVPDQVLFGADVLVVVIARDAFDWLRSLHRQPWHVHPDIKRLDFSGFIRSEWHSVWDDHVGGIDERHPMRAREMLHERDPLTGSRFAGPLAKRRAKLAHWAGLEERAPNLALLSYETLRRAPEQVVRHLGVAAGLEPAVPFQPVDSYKGQEIRPFRPTPYDPFRDEDLAWIEARLDPDLEGLYGLPHVFAGRPS
ncbi:hypothetical protein [Aureimonas jatrophae]|uniref:Sulfotransferase family protein n=1 Tax=Aureimonas jatrophae TaxID=1166073 RepID=A0A1H0ER04_9HYPH|nr:hypothetical protein [Aureimonas jatrophae]MBB3950358.1 hypothetical protein [Aureimonas jatrophae]SDN84798.1 hypothetical protein SAMN05192530_102178 [Aureimonas jatrophae]